MANKATLDCLSRTCSACCGNQLRDSQATNQQSIKNQSRCQMTKSMSFCRQTTRHETTTNLAFTGLTLAFGPLKGRAKTTPKQTSSACSTGKGNCGDWGVKPPLKLSAIAVYKQCQVQHKMCFLNFPICQRKNSVSIDFNIEGNSHFLFVHLGLTLTHLTTFLTCGSFAWTIVLLACFFQVNFLGMWALAISVLTHF